MTDGLLMYSPFASMIADGKKLTEYRDSKPPEDKIGVPIYVLSKGKVYAKIKIKNYFKVNINNQHSFEWNLELLKSYKPPVHYEHPMGAQKWVKNVVLSNVLKQKKQSKDNLK